MRALFYNHTGRASGAERVLILALQNLNRTIVTPYVVCPPGELAREIRSLRIPLETISELQARFTLWPHRLLAYAFSLLKTVFALRSAIRTSNVDVVHANSPRAGIAALFATAGTSLPVIWHVHDELKPHPLTTLIRWIACNSPRCSIVAVSGATAESFVGDSPKLGDRVRVIHNAVDVAAIDQEVGTSSIRDELGLAKDDILFGIVGQITPRKGQSELIRAFAKVAADMPAAKLLVVGSPIFNKDTIYQQELFDLVASLGLAGRVLFLGHRTDATDIVKQLDCLVINSESEAFVMVGLEAMACRTPIIATDVGGTREMIADGFNGLLIRAGDEHALTAALIKMFSGPELRATFAGRSWERVENEFNIDRFSSEIHAALITAATAVRATVFMDKSVRATENS